MAPSPTAPRWAIQLLVVAVLTGVVNADIHLYNVTIPKGIEGVPGTWHMEFNASLDTTIHLLYKGKSSHDKASGWIVRKDLWPACGSPVSMNSKCDLCLLHSSASSSFQISSETAYCSDDTPQSTFVAWLLSPDTDPKYGRVSVRVITITATHGLEMVGVALLALLFASALACILGRHRALAADRRAAVSDGEAYVALS
jgi:hypothetical protein